MHLFKLKGTADRFIFSGFPLYAYCYKNKSYKKICLWVFFSDGYVEQTYITDNVFKNECMFSHLLIQDSKPSHFPLVLCKYYEYYTTW